MKRSEASKPLSTVERFAALSRVGTALMSELDETRLLHLIAETARELTGAAFAAFSLRPMNEEGQPLVPSEGNLFHLAAVVGVTPEQEALLHRMPLGGEGLLAPIFRNGVPVRVADALALVRRPHEQMPGGHLERSRPTARGAVREAATAASPAETHTAPTTNKEFPTINRVPTVLARQAAFDYAHGQLSKEDLRSLGVPRGHPVVRSFLGAPLLDHMGQVRGGLLLGHSEPDRFTQEDETLLVGLASQAAVALENARLYRMAQMRAQQLDRIFESIGDGVTLVDSRGNIVRENGTARRVREQLKNAPEGQHVVAALLHGPAKQALNGEAVQDISVSIGSGQQEAREYLVTASPLHLPPRPSGPLVPANEATHPAQNGVSGAVVVWHDVTERHLREAERQARAHARQLEAIFEAMTDGVFVYDSYGAIVQINTAARKLFALDLDPEYASRSLEERLPLVALRDKDGQSLPKEQWPPLRLLKGEVLTEQNAMEVLARALDGREVEISIGGAPLYDQQGQIAGAVMTVHDMSEHRRLEEIERRAYEETEARRALLQLILDELPSSVYLVRGPDARLVLANNAGTAMWGAEWPYDQPMDEFFTQHSIRIFGMNGQPLEPSQLAALRAAQQGETMRQHLESIRLPDGTILPVLVNAVALDGHQLHMLAAQPAVGLSEGAELAALVVQQDVTALKEAERLKDEFIAIAAHELRNPLAALKGYTQMLLLQTARGKGPLLADWQQEAIEIIDRSTLRLVDLTGDLLDVTRLQAGGLILHLEPTDLVALVRRIVKRLQVTTEQHSFSIATPLDYLVVPVDPGRLEQVLSNLVGNAIKYSPDGGPNEVTIGEDVQGNEALLSIRDRGIGIPQQEQAHIFARFARAGNARARGIGGTGLGLYLCRELVELHRGRIWFESCEGLGSTFFIALPAVVDAATIH